jgi:peptidoglycan/LPS O-acetylase OafA/YrhL
MLPSTIWYYIFVVPNIPFALHLSGHVIVTIPLLTHYWSVGVEEQFYAFWPWLIKYSSKIKQSIFLFCAAYFGLKIGLSIMNAPIFWQSILLHTRFCCLGIGAIGACLYFENSKIVAFSNKKVIELLAWLILMLFMMNQISVFSIVNNEIISVLVVIIILNQINNPSPILSLENKVFDYVGKISFGLYIFNPLLIYFTSSFLLNNSSSGITKTILFVVCTFCAVILVSHLSYFYFEKRFLKLKTKFTTVESAASKF